MSQCAESNMTLIISGNACQLTGIVPFTCLGKGFYRPRKIGKCNDLIINPQPVRFFLYIQPFSTILPPFTAFTFFAETPYSCRFWSEGTCRKEFR